MEASAARVDAANAKIQQARSGYLPQLNYQESYARSNNPVFVFGSLLTQHQFTERNFAIGGLNRPDFLNNFQSALSVDQTVWDAGMTKNRKKSAELGKNIASEQARSTRMQVIANVVRAYHGVGLAAESLKVAREAVRSAEADLKRAEALRAAGMATDADVLSVKVHLAAMREQQIERKHDLEVARAALNEALGLPLDTPHDLRIAETQSKLARAAYWPQVSVRAAFEADRQDFVDKGGANWFFGATMRWNLFNGFATKERVAEASQALRGARAEQRRADAGVRLQVRQAYAREAAARERVQVATAAVAQAQESLRITRNRYEAGLTTVTDLLRNETALLEAKTRRLAAVYDQRVSAAMLELAAGTLSVNSDVLN